MEDPKRHERGSRDGNIKLSINGLALSDGSGETSGAISSRDKIRARLHQRSSRLLSLIGLRYPAHIVKPIHVTDAANILDQEPESPTQKSITNSVNTKDNVTSSPRKEMDRTILHDAIGSTNTDVVRSQSSPVELARIVSKKLSVTFGSPTVIKRRNPNSRPNIRAVHFPSAPNTPLKGNGNQSNDTSDSSSCRISRDSRKCSLSTPPTSVEPSSTLTGSDQSKDARDAQFVKSQQNLLSLDHETGTLSSIQEVPAASPSILTVEAAANAKVFFETHFNMIFSGLDSRLQRQQELEQYILSLHLTPDDKVKVKNKWAVQEREYLRQCRVLKTRSHRSSMKNTASSIAGFEMIKVLGKGSFGVVRLVREITDNEYEISRSGTDRRFLYSAETSSQTAPAQRGPKCGHRKSMIGMKKNVFAMKVIRKSIMIRNSQEAHLRAERDFLVASAKSRWVVPLIASFQDDDNLYLVMDYMIGGDFLGLLMRRNILPENITRWYVAEMILCVEEAHRLNWIHRDIKPDNFLISASGHLKISDFGLAFDGHWAHNQVYYKGHRYSLLKRLGIQVDGDDRDQMEAKTKESQTGHREDDSIDESMWTPPPNATVLSWRDRNLKRRRANSVVGTSQYMAPEVIRGHFYDGRCDWWSIGIILYECLYGFTPFVSEDRHKTKMRIHHHLQTLYFPVHRPADKLVSAEAVDLISYLLQEKEYRLSSSKYRDNDAMLSRHTRSLFYNIDTCCRNYRGPHVFPDDATEIKAHPFFKGVDWDELHRTSPPFVPKIKGWEDTRYFDNANAQEPDSVETDSDEDDPKEGEGGAGDKQDPHQQNQGQCTKPQEVAEEGPAIRTEHPVNQGKKHKEPRRPRDKILRDKGIRKTALEMRKKGAFLGYTYQRPKGVILALAPDRGRPFFPRGQLSELYG